MNKTQRRIAFSRNLRRNLTEAEKNLWFHVRSRQLDGAKFRRQHPIGPYIVDFVDLERKIVIELDGGQHNEESGLRKDTVCFGFGTPTY